MAKTIKQLSITIIADESDAINSVGVSYQIKDATNPSYNSRGGFNVSDIDPELLHALREVVCHVHREVCVVENLECPSSSSGGG